MATKQLKQISREEVAKVGIGFLRAYRVHNTSFSITRMAIWYVDALVKRVEYGPTFHVQWIIIDTKVFDVSRFKDMHPGGAAVLVDAEVGR